MSSPTVELNRFFRPFFYTPKSGEQSTPENIRKQYNQLKSENKAPTLSQLSPGTSLGIGKFILGGILWLTGLTKDNSVLKWLGGLLTIGGAVLAGIGKFGYGVDLKADDAANGTGGPKPAPSPTSPEPPKELTDEQKKEASSLYEKLLTTYLPEERTKLIQEIKDKGYKLYAVNQLFGHIGLCPFESDHLRDLITALGDLADNLTAKPLLKMLNEEGLREPSSLSCVLKAISKTGDKSVIKDLIEYLKNVNNYCVAEACGHAIGNLADDESIQDEIISISQLNDPNKHRGAATALGYIKSAKSKQALINLLKDKRFSRIISNNSYIAEALIRQGDKESIVALLNHYDRLNLDCDSLDPYSISIKELAGINPDINVVITTLRDLLDEIKSEDRKNAVKTLIEKLESKAKTS